MNRGDAGVDEQLLSEGVDHLAAQPLTKSGAVTEELVNSEYSKINFVLPPPFAAPDGHVRLDESERFGVKVRDIRFDMRRTHHSWTVFPPDAFQIRGDIATAPPLDNVGPMQPVSKQRKVVLSQAEEGNLLIRWVHDAGVLRRCGGVQRYIIRAEPETRMDVPMSGDISALKREQMPMSSPCTTSM